MLGLVQFMSRRKVGGFSLALRSCWRTRRPAASSGDPAASQGQDAVEPAVAGPVLEAYLGMPMLRFRRGTDSFVCIGC